MNERSSEVLAVQSRMNVTKCLPNLDDEGENDELLWVKAGEPGEKPTIIRQIRSESSTSSSSRDNSGGSTTGNARRNVLTVENGTVFRTNGTSLDSIETIYKRTSSNTDSHVVVVNISEHIYPVHVDKQRIQKWRDLHSPRSSKKLATNFKPNGTTHTHTNENKAHEMKRPLSQPTRPLSNCSPTPIERCASSSGHFNRFQVLKTRDEGYTSLSEDCKDSDTESVRSKSLPSTWRPNYLNSQRQEQNLQKYAEKLTCNNSSGLHFSRCGRESHDDVVNKCTGRKCKRETGSTKYQIEKVVEICTCFVCLRSVFYHAKDVDTDSSLADHPCSCDEPSPKCCGRWLIIGVMVLFFPFLIFYPPLKCCLSIHESRKKKRRKKKERKILLQATKN